MARHGASGDGRQARVQARVQARTSTLTRFRSIPTPARLLPELAALAADRRYATDATRLGSRCDVLTERRESAQRVAAEAHEKGEVAGALL